MYTCTAISMWYVKDFFGPLWYTRLVLKSLILKYTTFLFFSWLFFINISTIPQLEHINISYNLFYISHFLKFQIWMLKKPKWSFYEQVANFAIWPKWKWISLLIKDSNWEIPGPLSGRDCNLKCGKCAMFVAPPYLTRTLHVQNVELLCALIAMG